jgi:hypothetical protein
VVPLYAARIEDLGPGDFLKVDRSACSHTALLTRESLDRHGLKPHRKVLDLKDRVRCCGRVVGNDNCVRYEGRVLQIPEQRHRRHFVKVTVQVHEYPDGTLAIFHGPRRLAGYRSDSSLIQEESSTRSAA